MPGGFRRWVETCRIWVVDTNNEIHPWRWRALIAWIIIFTAMVIFTLHKTYQSSGNANTAAAEAKNATSNIQSQRKESIRRGCEDQNARHNNTISILNSLIAKLPPDQRARAQANKEFTILLINALAPKQNCNLLVKKAVKTAPPITKERKRNGS